MGELALPIRSPPERLLAGRLWSDERLARAVAKGDPRAFTLLYQRHHQALYRYCRLIVRDEHDAQDALQSAMTRAFGALRAQERDLAVRPWLFRIAHNEAVTVLRKRRPTTPLTETLEPADVGVEDTLERRERLATLLADLQELSERGRTALVMRELSGLSIEEIAGVLSASPGATKQVLFEARAALHDFAEGRAMECEQIRRAVSDADRRALRGRRLRAHLRACPGCRDFQVAMSTRRTDFHALAPALAPLAATALLSRLMAGGAAGGHAGGLAAGSGGLAAGSGTAVGGSVAASSAMKVAALVAVAATAAGGARLAIVHTRSGAARPAVRSRAAPTSPALTTAPGGSRSGSTAYRSQAASGSHKLDPRAASKGIKTTAPGHGKAAPGIAGALGAAGTGQGSHALLGQALGRSEAQPGHGKASERPGRGGANRSESGSANSRRARSQSHRSGSAQATHKAGGKPNGTGKPGTSTNRPAGGSGGGGNGQGRTETGPRSAPQPHPTPAEGAPGTTGAPTQEQSGQSINAPTAGETEALRNHGRP